MSGVWHRTESSDRTSAIREMPIENECLIDMWIDFLIPADLSNSQWGIF